MLKSFTTSLFILLVVTCYPQSPGNLRTDLDRLHAILEKTPSYQDQVTGDKLKAYGGLLDSLRRNTANASSDYLLFYQLARLFFPFRDNHLAFYQLPTAVLDKSQFGDSAAVREYRTHSAFLEYPACNIDTDSLEMVLMKKPADSVEGIYHYEHYLKVGLFRSDIPGEWLGVVLHTTMPNWEKGQVAIRLYEDKPNAYRAIYGHPLSKALILYNNEKFRNRSLVNSYFYSSLSGSVYKKEAGTIDLVNIPGSAPKFELRRINPSVQYLRLGNFSAMNTDMKNSQAFYEDIKDSLVARHLIVDLRNNSGGAEKVSKRFFSLLKRFIKKGSVYVLVNNGTMSQGEIFTLQLRRLRNVIVYGQPTMGTLAYGSNYGKRERLPSGKYEVYITDMKNKNAYLAYENTGIGPDILLKADADWIEQVQRQIEKK